MAKRRFDDLARGAELRRVLTGAGWSVLDTYAVRKRYGCTERVEADGDWQVLYPDGHSEAGSERTAELAAMHTANLTYYCEFASDAGCAARMALLGIQHAADQAIADARAAGEDKERMTRARAAVEAALAAAARADRDGAVAALTTWRRRAESMMHLSGWPMP